MEVVSTGDNVDVRYRGWIKTMKKQAYDNLNKDDISLIMERFKNKVDRIHEK